MQKELFFFKSHLKRPPPPPPIEIFLPINLIIKHTYSIKVNHCLSAYVDFMSPFLDGYKIISEYLSNKSMQHIFEQKEKRGIS